MTLLRVTAITSLFVLWSISGVLAQQSFATPEEAVTGLRQAVKADSDEVWTELFGPQASKLLPQDSTSRTESCRLLEQLLEERAYIAKGEKERVLRLGLQGWPFPVPLASKDGSWQFDSEGGLEEILNRVIGRNELVAIETLARVIEAQEVYRDLDSDKDAVRSYAANFRSSDGEKDGLYWPAEEGDVSPLETSLKQAFRYTEGRTEGTPWFGYRYRLLTGGQGSDAPGGAHDYLVNGHLTGGYAIVAYPAEYGRTGVATFLCNQNGHIFQANLGEDTKKLGEKMERFELGESWSEVPWEHLPEF